MIRTRFAPSPTGYLHIGGLRTALYNYLFAKKGGGEFLLRIEDTDRSRFVSDAENYIKKSLESLGIIPDHGPGYGDGVGDAASNYRQSSRDNYRDMAMKLVEMGHAYFAFDTKGDMDSMRDRYQNFSYNHITRTNMRNSISLGSDETDRMLKANHPYVIRYKVEPGRTISFNDMIRGPISFNSSVVDDKVIFKSDGMPTYHLAVVVDDNDMKITHVIRGEEWLSSTPLHIMLYESFGLSIPEFAHLPLILDKNGKKVSKRAAIKDDYPIFPTTVNVIGDDGSIIGTSKGFFDIGFSSEALVSYLSLLGWTPDNGKEFMLMKEMIEEFDFSRVNNSGARFDIAKATHFNKLYIHSLGDDELLKHMNTSSSDVQYSDTDLRKIARMATERSSFLHELDGVVNYFFHRPKIYDVGLFKDTPDFDIYLNELIQAANSEVDAVQLSEKAITICESLGFNRRNMLNNVRVAMTGGCPGPKLHEMFDVMKNEEVVIRLKKAKKAIEHGN